MNTQNYTLEKHLEAICKEDSDYNVLLAAWRLNKENLALALSTISSSFPHYSRHDATHSSKILDNIQRLLGQDRIERLGATDTFLMLMAAMMHDLGMYLYYGMLEEKWKEDKMEALLKNYSQSDDKTIAQAARLLLNFNRCTDDPAQSYLWALEIKNAVTLIIAHQMRGGHEKRSAQYIEDDDFIAKLTHGFHFELLPSRFLTLLSKVAYLHGTNFDEVMEILKQNADGYKGDYIHPRFIACMIRMGDLLDIDSNRFNDFASSMIKEVPESSKAHYDKHQAVKHLLISPSGIEAELDCKTDASYRVARQVFDWLEKEVENLSRHWSRISPYNLGGLPPVLHTDSINILYNGTRTRPELMNLRFDISSKKTFEMLKGGAIYNNPGRVFLREIVQNAMDATKLQIWQDLKDGYYLPCKLENPDREIKTICDIKFSDDIPADVYDKYPIKLSVEFIEKKEDEKEGKKDDKKRDKRCEKQHEKKSEKRIEGLRIICEDYGTGISEESLIRMTSKVGESRKADKDYEKTIKEMPYFLQPTAAFGLGLQTIFYVANEFIVETCCPDKTSRRIIFRTSTNGSYCSVDKEEIDMHRGTKVIIEIDKDHYADLFELDEVKTSQLMVSPEGVGYYTIEKLNKYIESIFKQTENIPFFYHSPFGDFRSIRANDEFEHIKNDDKDDPDFRISSLLKDDGIVFRIEEKKYGSILEMSYCSDTKRYYGFDDNKVLLRDVHIKCYIDSYSYRYAKFKWNLFCREADSFVTISRDSLLPQGYVWCKKTLDELMPKIIQLTLEILLDKYNNTVDKQIKHHLQIQYLSAKMIDWQLSEPTLADISPIKELQLPLRWASDNKLKSIHAERLLNASIIVVVNDEYDRYYGISKDGLKEQLSQIEPPFNNSILSWDGIYHSIPNSFICSKIMFLSREIYERPSYLMIKDDSVPGYQMVEISDEDIHKYAIWYLDLESYFNNNYEPLPGFKRYEAIVVSDAPLLGGYKPYHCNCWIYPLDLKVLKEIVNGEHSREKLEQKLTKESIKKLVPDHIVRLIQKYRIIKDKPLTEDDIYNTYIRLILDFKSDVDEPSKQKK